MLITCLAVAQDRVRTKLYKLRRRAQSSDNTGTGKLGVEASTYLRQPEDEENHARNSHRLFEDEDNAQHAPDRHADQVQNKAAQDHDQNQERQRIVDVQAAANAK